MRGAKEYARLIPTGLYGRLYCMSSRHARGSTFHIYVLPKGATGISEDSVEVYGIIGGHPGWSEEYGWLRRGKWQEDFKLLLASKKKEKEEDRLRDEKRREALSRDTKERETELLDDY